MTSTMEKQREEKNVHQDEMCSITVHKKKQIFNLGKWKFKHYLTKMTSYYFLSNAIHIQVYPVTWPEAS